MKNHKTLLQAFGILALTFGLLFQSCKKDEINNEQIIEEYGLTGNFIFEVKPTLVLGNTVLTKGEIEGLVTHEGNGVLRLRFAKFNASPMPFEMTVDLQMTLLDRKDFIQVNNLKGKSNFIAIKPEDSGDINPDDVPGGFELTEEQLKNGISSKGNSEVKGTIKKLEDGNIQYDLTLDPKVGLPITIKIKSVRKL